MESAQKRSGLSGRRRNRRRAGSVLAIVAHLGVLAPSPDVFAQSPAAVSPAARPSLSPPPGTRSLPSGDSYLLGAGDQLEISFISPAYANLGGGFELLNDGSTSLPMLGSVVLEGLTVNQASRWLTGLYARYLRDPSLNLQVRQPRAMQVSVVGEVENPGLYLLSARGESSQVEGQEASVPGLPTVVTLLQKAGGITLNANLTDVRLRRRIPGDDGQLKEIQLDLVALLQRGDKRQNPFLFDGDTVLISRAPAPPPEEVLELAAANLSPQSIQVNVVGEVKSPGRVPLRAGTPLIQAVMAAGGPTAMRANRNNIELVRINRNGTATLRRYSLDLSLGVSGPRNPPLRDGDTVVVNRSTLATGSDALAAVSTPLSGLANILALMQILQNVNGN